MEDNKIVSIYSANIHKDNRWLSRLIKDINNKRPDIILLLEVRPRHVDKLRYILGKYKYKIIDPKMYKTGIGLIFLSKYPVKSFNITNISESGNGIIRSVLDVKGKQVVYYGVHLPRISMDRSFKFKQRIFIKLASIIAEESLPLIVTGDFNSTPYSPIFKKLIDISKLKYPDYEWNPTWPSFFPPLWIPIDHVLVKHDAQIHELTKGGFIFSDHFPIFAKISLS
jgi:endonuclease/exonuclease/phosphatase family metal-dependent hydrolase